MNKWPDLLPEDYNTYTDICKKAVEDDNIFNTFKSQPRYTDILEHTLPHQANEYINLISKSYNDLEIPCEDLFKNDDIGSPQKSGFLFKDMQRIVSPSNFRYLYYGLEILSFLQENDILETSIIEIGGGYGGQCYYLSKLAPIFDIKIKKYLIFDLEDPSKLSKKFLDKIGIKNVKCEVLPESRENITEYNFIFSNYAYSEFDASVRKEYLDKVISKVKSGYFAWNTEAEYDSYFSENSIFRVYPEKPETRPGNKIITFIKNTA